MSTLKLRWVNFKNEGKSLCCLNKTSYNKAKVSFLLLPSLELWMEIIGTSVGVILTLGLQFASQITLWTALMPLRGLGGFLICRVNVFFNLIGHFKLLLQHVQLLLCAVSVDVSGTKSFLQCCTYALCFTFLIAALGFVLVKYSSISCS